MKQISSLEVKKWLEEQKDFLLLDVREGWENEEYNIGGINMPLGVLISRRNELDPEKTTVIYCEKGIRSVIAIQRLEEYGFINLYNLSGGMQAWKQTFE